MAPGHVPESSQFRPAASDDKRAVQRVECPHDDIESLVRDQRSRGQIEVLTPPGTRRRKKLRVDWGLDHFGVPPIVGTDSLAHKPGVCNEGIHTAGGFAIPSPKPPADDSKQHAAKGA